MSVGTIGNTANGQGLRYPSSPQGTLTFYFKILLKIIYITIMPTGDWKCPYCGNYNCGRTSAYPTCVNNPVYYHHICQCPPTCYQPIPVYIQYSEKSPEPKVPTGWQCPICKRILSPNTPFCNCLTDPPKEEDKKDTPILG
jgi:hypothetical protein